jgi:hypothetical protein
MTAADDAALGFHVTPHNVLGAYATLAQEVERLRWSLRIYNAGVSQGMGLCGGDPVSEDAARGFTELSKQLGEMCGPSVEQLHDIAEGLRRNAQSYGKTDEDFAAAFDPAKYVFKHVPYQRSQCVADPRELG